MRAATTISTSTAPLETLIDVARQHARTAPHVSQGARIPQEPLWGRRMCSCARAQVGAMRGRAGVIPQSDET